MNLGRSFVLLFAVILLSACADMIPEAAQPAEPTEESSAHTNQTHWSYEEGPQNWEGDCRTGESQSPINIINAEGKELENIAIYYEDDAARILNNGHTVQAEYDNGYIEVDGERYNVAQFHYHAPSEHTIDGKSFAAELHIVHVDVNDNKKVKAVIGILFEEGTENLAYQPFLSNLPGQEDEEITGIAINAVDLLPSLQTTFRYDGSLTTPPCTEEVLWFVMTTPVQLSADQLAKLESVFEGNNRPIQVLNERPLIEDTTP